MGQISKIHIFLKTYPIQFIIGGWIQGLVPYNPVLVNPDRIRISEVIQIFQNYPISPSNSIQFSSYLMGGYRVQVPTTRAQLIRNVNNFTSYIFFNRLPDNCQLRYNALLDLTEYFNLEVFKGAIKDIYLSNSQM